MVKRLSNEEFKSRLFNVYGEEYQNIEEYKTKRTKIKFKHSQCGTEFLSYPMDVIRGMKKCPICMRKKLKEINLKSIEQFNIDFNKVSNGKYELLGEYVSSRDKIKILHKECGTKWDVNTNNFLQGRSYCPKCSKENTIKRLKSKTKPHEKFVQEVENLGLGEYEVISKYIKSRESIILKHKVCGNEWETKPDWFLMGNRCPKCNTHQNSKGVQKIKRFLDENNVKYITEYKMKKCKRIRPLPFDFAIFEEDKLKCLIEYDGIQHFKPKSFGSENNKDENFKLLKESEEIKNKFCIETNIKLIRIPYFEFENIDKILSEVIS